MALFFETFIQIAAMIALTMVIVMFGSLLLVFILEVVEIIKEKRDE